ncbi:hypothetical protein SAMN04487948_11348 [Halogranum amylolyticum]|uniref:Uncharacterized protein n=1 Tax=Halogranum amylolyticum TaxID=660520 RepID=A0A1H8UYT5_9EURY|nr:hypothetical protein SAMN04487948_11348 [Halogranum amylolyticum]
MRLHPRLGLLNLLSKFSTQILTAFGEVSVVVLNRARISYNDFLL